VENCLILGSGRSGTSMVAGALAAAGYFMGRRLHRPREANPKGFFESPQVNRTNDALLRQAVPTRPPLLQRWVYRQRLCRRHMWLARVPVGTYVPPIPRQSARIRRLVHHEPYCFKDPRFCYTLGVWRPFIAGAVFVCVFRDPAATVASIVKEVRSRRYHGLPMTAETAFDIYTQMYRHVLEVHRHSGRWLFLHYDQVLRGDGLDRLAEHVRADVDRDFPEPRLRRSKPRAPVPRQTKRIYRMLCEKAEYEPPRAQAG
jgi:hypothetical protein